MERTFQCLQGIRLFPGHRLQSPVNGPHLAAPALDFQNPKNGKDRIVVLVSQMLDQEPESRRLSEGLELLGCKDVLVGRADFSGDEFGKLDILDLKPLQEAKDTVLEYPLGGMEGLQKGGNSSLIDLADSFEGRRPYIGRFISKHLNGPSHGFFVIESQRRDSCPSHLVTRVLKPWHDPLVPFGRLQNAKGLKGSGPYPRICFPV